MKRIALTVLLGMFLATSCEKQCGIKRPKDLKPIDWENYNDVATVYWNLSGCCNDKVIKQYRGRTIKVYGWLYQGYNETWENDCINWSNGFGLVADSTQIFARNIPSCPVIGIGVYPDFEITNFDIDTSNLRQKCYITGKYIMSDMPTSFTCKQHPAIFADSSFNIHN